jgi:hypothetical protein
MRSRFLLALLLLSAAVLIGCSKKRDSAEQNSGPIVIGGPGAVVAGGGDGEGKEAGGPIVIGGRQDEPPPPWPPLPEVPAPPKSFPNTHGGQIAWAMDKAATDLISHGSPEKETFDRWEIYCFRRAFKEAEPAIKGFPKVQLDKELFAPAGNAGKERDILDKSFARLFAAWTRYWEMQRRWEVVRSEELLHRLEPKWSPKKLREEAEKGNALGHEVKIDDAVLPKLIFGKHDWYTVDVSSTEDVHWTSLGGWINGRVAFKKKLTIWTGPMALILTGSAGELTLAPGGPAVIDLAEMYAPIVRVQCWEDVVVRVGPGVQKLEIDPRHGIVLARGAPNLKVQNHADRHPVAIVGY